MCAAGRFLCSEIPFELFHGCQHTQVSLYSSGVVVADVVFDHLDKFLLAGKASAVVADKVQ